MNSLLLLLSPILVGLIMLDTITGYMEGRFFMIYIIFASPMMMIVSPFETKIRICIEKNYTRGGISRKMSSRQVEQGLSSFLQIFGIYLMTFQSFAVPYYLRLAPL